LSIYVYLSLLSSIIITFLYRIFLAHNLKFAKVWAFRMPLCGNKKKKIGEKDGFIWLQNNQLFYFSSPKESHKRPEHTWILIFVLDSDIFCVYSQDLVKLFLKAIHWILSRVLIPCRANIRLIVNLFRES